MVFQDVEKAELLWTIQRQEIQTTGSAISLCSWRMPEALLGATCGFAELQTRVSLILLFILSQPNSPWTSVMSDRGSGGNAIIRRLG